MDSKKAILELEKEIVEYEEHLKGLREALRILKKNRPKSADSRFSGMQPIEAIGIVLDELGPPGPTADELNTLLVAGGISSDKRPNYSIVPVSLKVNVRNENLAVVNGHYRKGPNWARYRQKKSSSQQ